MYSKILSFFNKHNLFYKYQFGFRERHGTDITLIVCIDKILSALNEGDYVLGVFLDLSKAFDHNILLMKLYKYGIRGVAYVGSRVTLRRESNMCHSTNMIPAPWTSNVEFPRVPYWDHYCSLYMSMISPMFYLYYLHYCLQIIPMSLLPGKNLSNLFTTMNSELVRLSEWINVNKLSLNVKKKTSICYFAPKPPVWY